LGLDKGLVRTPRVSSFPLSVHSKSTSQSHLDLFLTGSPEAPTTMTNEIVEEDRSITELIPITLEIYRCMIVYEESDEEEQDPWSNNTIRTRSSTIRILYLCGTVLRGNNMVSNTAAWALRYG
jgi:hypothetical protein